MRTSETIDRTRDRGRGTEAGSGHARAATPRAGALVAVAAAAAFLVAGCSASSSAAGGGATTAPAGGGTATAAPAAATDAGGGGYEYSRTDATAAPAATAEAGGGAGGAVGLATDASAGPFLTGENGMTLYIFTKDGPGKTVCYDQCAVNWPPFTLEAGETVTAAAGISGAFGTITRSDGSTQVTYRDLPLYYYVADRNAGDVTGQGVGGVWFVAAP